MSADTDHLVVNEPPDDDVKIGESPDGDRLSGSQARHLLTTRRKVLIGLGTLGTIAAIAEASLSGSSEGGTLWGGTVAWDKAYKIGPRKYAGPDAIKNSDDVLGAIPDDEGWKYDAIDTQVEYHLDDGAWQGPEGHGSASVPAGASHFQSISTESASIEERPTGPESSHVGEHGGLATAAVPNATLYSHRSDPFKIVEFQSGNELYATDNSGSTGAVYKSTDLGMSWTEQGTVGVRVGHLFKITTTGTLIAIEEDNSVNDVYRSTDDGASWSKVHSLDHKPIHQDYTETPSGHILIGEYKSTSVTTHKIYRSTDDGATWSAVATFDEADNYQHVHAVQYDDTEGKAVAFVDKGSPEVWVSSDEGANWSQLGVADDSKNHPNYVALMFFPNYIAWAYDAHANRGQIGRLTREDFYNNNWDNAEVVGEFTDKMGYYTHPIASDMWLVSFASESLNNVPNSTDVFIVYDDAEHVAGGFEWVYPKAELDTLAGSKAHFPTVPFDETLDNISWVNLEFDGFPQGQSGVPMAVGRKSAMTTYMPGGAFGNWAIPEDASYGQYEGGTFNAMFRYNNGKVNALDQFDMQGNQFKGIRQVSAPDSPQNFGGKELAWDETNNRIVYRDESGTAHFINVDGTY